MKKKLLTAISLAAILTLTFTSLAFAADPAYVMFTADAPCAVTVLVTNYTDSNNQAGQIASGSTPWQLDTYPSTSVTFFYPTSVDCNGTIYNFVSVSPNSPVTSGAVGTTTTVTGHYTLPVPEDITPPVWTVPADFNVEATSPSGTVVTYTSSASDPDDAVSSQSCLPASGSTFALGTTTVNCTATDTNGNIGTASFNVTVVDTTSPVLTLPSDMTVSVTSTSGAMVNFITSANDLVDGSIPVTCSPISGSLFTIGTTTVNCSAIDSHGNMATGSFNITVNDNEPPVLTLPSDITVSATSASGAVVNFVANANDAVDGPVPVTCLPASGSLFPIGATEVSCQATDSQGNSAFGVFNVTVVDNEPPVLTLPSDITVSATSASGAVVSFAATANDALDGPVPVSCLPASGSLFPIGTTDVSCQATDSQGNSAFGVFNVTVVDNEPPILTLPSDIFVTASNASGAVVTFTVSAHDLVDGSVPVNCSPSSGSNFTFGMTTVNCSATDSKGNMATGSFNVTVQYATAGIKCNGVPGHQILEPINADGSSIFKQGSTVPAKFRVCGADGVAIGTPGTVASFRLVRIITDGTTQNVDQAVSSTTPSDAFRSGSRQWIFDINTKDLDADSTYVFLITLNDGSSIQFQFSLK